MRILQRLKEYDGSLTVTELIEQIENEQSLKEIKEHQEIEVVKKDFTNTYLKVVDEEGIFGRELKVIYIKEIADTTRTTDWELLYFVEGNKITFYKDEISLISLKGNSSSDTFSEKDLRNMVKITEEEYNNYSKEYHSIYYKLNQLINGK